MKIFYDMFFTTPISEENSDKLLFLLNGILSEIIFDKATFNSNLDLKEFTSTVLNKDYKLYLFAGRPTLYAKVIKDLRDSKVKDSDNFFITISNISRYLENELDNQEEKIDKPKKDSLKKKNNKKKDDVIDGWRKIINKN